MSIASTTTDPGRPAGAAASPRSAPRSAPTGADIALLILRIGVGVVLIAHGGQKLFAMTLPGVVQGFAGMGVPLAGLVGPAVTFIELVGGVAIIVGVLSRLFSLLSALTLVGAIAVVHAPSGFYATDGGIELPLLLIVAELAIVVAGPGALSLGRTLSGRRALLA